MNSEHDCTVSIVETTEYDQPSFLASTEALAVFSQILEMTPEEAQEALEDLESQKVCL